LAVVLSVFRLTASDYYFGILKLFLANLRKQINGVFPNKVAMSVTFGRSVVFSGYFDFLHQ